MQVNVRSGRDQGSHYAFAQRPTCTYGVAGEGSDRADSWGSQYDGGGDDLSALTIVVPNGGAAKRGEGTPVFAFSAVIRGTTYAVDTRIGAGAKGRGLVKVLDYGATAIISLDARTADGTRLDAVIQCNVITGPDGQPLRRP